jgi:hypothetical protein
MQSLFRPIFGGAQWQLAVGSSAKPNIPKPTKSMFFLRVVALLLNWMRNLQKNLKSRFRNSTSKKDGVDRTFSGVHVVSSAV